MTNYERIKEMSVSELADFLMDGKCHCINDEICSDGEHIFLCDDKIAKSGITQWLISEVEE